MRRLLAVSIFGATMGLSLPSAHADHACRQEARDLYKEALNASGDGELLALVEEALGAHPECRSEFATLVAWNPQVSEFPFPAADDPTHNFLGPVGWWWNTVYVDWFGRNVAMMFLFGWEIFLIPIFMAFGLVSAVLSSAKEAVTS